MPAREMTNCRRCGRVIETNEKALAIFMFCQTAMIKPRRKASAEAIYICPTCTFSLAIKPAPLPDDFFNFAAYCMIRRLVGADRPEVRHAFEQVFALMIAREGAISDSEMRLAMQELVAGEPEVLPPGRAMQLAT